MRINDTYSNLQNSFSIQDAHPVFRSWGYNDADLRRWFTRSTPQMKETAGLYLREVEAIVAKVEKFFDANLIGELVLIPSMGEIDGFARYDRGNHTVMLGIDFPDANLDYLRALTAHELSHVYRDHSPSVWGFLKKPLKEISREEYLEASTGREHLVSEGLATLTSQHIYPEVNPHDHHYYAPEEMDWCLANHSKIDQALIACLESQEPDPWRFYRNGVVAHGSPSRTHYYWAAQKIAEWIKKTPGMTLIQAHTLAAEDVRAF